MDVVEREKSGWHKIVEAQVADEIDQCGDNQQLLRHGQQEKAEDTEDAERDDEWQCMAEMTIVDAIGTGIRDQADEFEPQIRGAEAHAVDTSSEMLKPLSSIVDFS